MSPGHMLWLLTIATYQKIIRVKCLNFLRTFQRRFYIFGFFFQNPSDCQAARKLLCGVCRDLGDCGFACFIHHIAHCLVTAYLSNRTMIMDCEGWKYSVKGPEVAFLPLSNCSLKHVGPVKKGQCSAFVIPSSLFSAYILFLMNKKY